MSKTVSPAVRDMSDDELLALYATRPRAALAECQRRDAAAYAKMHRDAIRAEWAEGAFALYLQAEAETRGNMLSRKGEAAGIDPWSLFSGPERRVACYASEELRNFFLDHPRVTLAEYTRQRAASLQAQQDEYEADSDTAEVECDNVTEERNDDDGRVEGPSAERAAVDRRGCRHDGPAASRGSCGRGAARRARCAGRLRASDRPACRRAADRRMARYPGPDYLPGTVPPARRAPCVAGSRAAARPFAVVEVADYRPAPRCLSRAREQAAPSGDC